MAARDPFAAAEIMPEVAKHPFKKEIMHAGNAVLADGTIVDW
jgi:hypothetical protein